MGFDSRLSPCIGDICRCHQFFFVAIPFLCVWPLLHCYLKCSIHFCRNDRPETRQLYSDWQIVTIARPRPFTWNTLHILSIKMFVNAARVFVTNSRWNWLRIQKKLAHQIVDWQKLAFNTLANKNHHLLPTVYIDWSFILFIFNKITILWTEAGKMELNGGFMGWRIDGFFLGLKYYILWWN